MEEMLRFLGKLLLVMVALFLVLGWVVPGLGLKHDLVVTSALLGSAVTGVWQLHKMNR